MITRISLLTLGTACIASLGAAQTPYRVTQFKELVRYQLSDPMQRTASVAFGDVNGDAYIDLLIGNVGADNCLLVNNGKGQFVDETSKRLPPAQDTPAAAFVDIDLDGDLDLILGKTFVQGELPIRIYVNDGTGRFTDESYPRLPVEIYAFGQTRDLSVGDIDGDSFPDLVVSIVSGDPVLPVPTWPTRIYASMGGGYFRDHSLALPPTIFDRTCSVLVDVDQDRDLDLVFGTVEGAPSELYLNDGLGNFGAFNGLPVFPDDTLAIEAADLTKDGRLDLIVGNRAGDRVYVDNGNGQFVEKPGLMLPVGFGPTYAIAAGDLDGDGDQDIVLAKDGANRVYLMANGTLIDATEQRLPLDFEPTRALALGDVERDGDLDLVAGNGASFPHRNRLYMNLHRQVHAPGYAIAGTKYQIDFYACPGYAAETQYVIPYISAGELVPPVNMPPLGYWGLDPVGLVILAAAPTNAEGLLTLFLDVPMIQDVPFNICTQALMLHEVANWPAWRLSNVIADQVVMPTRDM